MIRLLTRLFRLVLRSPIQSVAWLLAGSGMLVFVGFLIRAWLDGYWFWGRDHIDFGKTGEFGDFIGGFVGTMVSTAGFIFLYLTLVDQRRSTAEQRRATIRERFESRFFELVKFHRENVDDLKFESHQLVINDGTELMIKIAHDGRPVFKAIFEQFNNLRNELKPFFNQSKGEVYVKEALEELKGNSVIKERKIDLNLLASIDISYSIVFYGVSPEGLLVLPKLFKDRYRTGFVQEILNFVQLKPAPDATVLWQKWQRLSGMNSHRIKAETIKQIYLERNKNRLSPSIEDILSAQSREDIIQGYHNDFVKYYEGHQFRLGHYFRHLYQTVKYVNDQESIDYTDKYEFVKTLRAQLSTHEQAVLFLNSLSKLGRSWELTPDGKPARQTVRGINEELITKYNMIKNLPGESLYGIPFKKFYPRVQYEGSDLIRDNSQYT